MSDIQTDTEARTEDPHHRLTTDLFRVATFKLHQFVPPPNTDDPELIAQFVHEAIGEIASMVPANAEEIGIAVRVVAADAQAADCMLHAHRQAGNTPLAVKCHAQADHYFRTANAARALLARVQATRRKREAVAETRNGDAWTIHCTEGLFLAAAKGDPIPDLPPVPPAPEPPPPGSAADDDKFARMTPAEQYAVIYPRRAAEIRVHGGVPANATWGRPEPDIVQGVLASTSPILQQIDQEFARRPRT